MNPVDISNALRNYKTPPGRLRVIEGRSCSVILDDTYNAAPAAMEAALETLTSFPANRRIAVLGDMLELGTYSEEVHRKIGSQIPGKINILMTVGTRSVALGEEAVKSGFDSANLYNLKSSRDVAKVLLPMLGKGDAVLVKGGQSMRMERVVEAIMAEPEKAPELLTRQSVDWKRIP